MKIDDSVAVNNELHQTVRIILFERNRYDKGAERRSPVPKIIGGGGGNMYLPSGRVENGPPTIETIQSTVTTGY